MAERTVVDTPEAFHDAVARVVEGTGPVAFDAERASGFRYSQRAYLIQVFRRDAGTFLFDPPAIGRFDRLDEAIADEEWILHAAHQDIACLREVGLEPRRLFDTELAARLLGEPRVALGTVVEEMLGVHLEKAYSAVDWSTRPLPTEWLQYAALDVELLVDLRDRLEQRLVDEDKIEIAWQEFDAEIHRPPREPRAEPWRRLAGIHAVKGARNLAVARELWYARDELARRLDTAPGRLVPDASLVLAAQELPRSRSELAGLRRFHGRASRNELDRWWSAIERGLATTEPPTRKQHDSDYPPPRTWKAKNPAAWTRLRASRARLAEIAEERTIPAENLLAPEMLKRLSWQPPTVTTADAFDLRLTELGARPWQREATASALAEVFASAEAEAATDRSQESSDAPA